ncbi:hypothetical protein MMC16_006950 [Acarospora aff. strigata]|nr:hypothetical protein [Acarospora aff. strigata]
MGLINLITTQVLVLNLCIFLSLSRAYTALSNKTLLALPSPGNDFDIRNGAILAPILQPRVPGTPGSTAVLTHLVAFFKNTLPEWNIEFQNSTSTTPATGAKQIPFVNMIATRDPPWTAPGEVGRLTLVAHYDSKLTPSGFIGATDSAAPCAMLMHAARSLDSALTKKWASMSAEGLGHGGYSGVEEHKGLQIIFLDGEEAFTSWTDTDSIYGARSLAEAWEHQFHPALSTYRTALSSISLFLLLDLLGAKDPHVPSYFKTTHWAYAHMASLETRLRSLRQFKSSPNHPSKRSISTKQSKARLNKPRQERLFLPEAKKTDDRFLGGMVLDDHVPFMARGVDVLHIIPTPFPRVWHELDDDGEHLDMDTVEDWALLTTAFAAEWMDLEGFFESTGENVGRGDEEVNGRGRKRGKAVTSKTEL